MGTEAQKLISISLEKMATCRRRRREMSLHKNLLLTTVIHKARIAIMEETYYMMNGTGADADDDCPTNEQPCHNPDGMLRPVVTSYESSPLYYNNNNNINNNGQQSYQQHLYDDGGGGGGAGSGGGSGDNVPMDWEGSDGLAPVLSPQSSVIIVSATAIRDDIMDNDKENICPIDGTLDNSDSSNIDHDDQQHVVGLGQQHQQDDVHDDDAAAAAMFSTTCCQQRFEGGGGRSHDCQFLRNKSATSTTGIVIGQKRLIMDILMDDDDDDMDMGGGGCEEQKKLKWDSMMDPDSDTSHALRLVSVLSASLSGNSSTTTMSSCTSTSTLSSSVSSSSVTPPPQTRLVRSISSPDLCSKQAKDAMDIRTCCSSVERTVMAIAV